MGARFYPPVFQFENSAGVPYAGGTLTFYAANSSTPQDTYSDAALTTPNANPLTLNSAGWPATAIFLQNLPYKVVLKDSSGNEIWTADPVSTTDFGSVAITKVGAGDPTGNVAGTAGSAGVLPTMYWSYTTEVLYVCTATGTSSTAEWSAINAAAATPAVPSPQGYLTPTSGTPVILSDSAAATTVYYTPFVGNLVPIYNGARFVPTEFTERTLTLASQHTASNIFDVFMFSDDGVLTLVTGPAWSSATAGSGSRGTGAGTTQLTRLNGYWVNAVSMTGRNGTDTFTVAANLGTYLGSLFIDGTNGQVTCHRAFGQSRKWGIWNAYNRQPLYLKAGDSTASWTYTTATIRASNNATANSLTVFQGLAEEVYDLRFEQNANTNSSSTTVITNGIGWNSTTAMSGKSGKSGKVGELTGDDTLTCNLTAAYRQVPNAGINVVTALENAPTASGTNTWFGGEDDMMLSAGWRG